MELYRDGYFKFYENDHCPNAEDTIFMPSECIAIKTGYQIDSRHKQPPTGLATQLMFSVSSINNKVWIFCAESMNELKAWINNLEEARLSMMLKSAGYPNQLLFNQTLARNSMNPLMPSPLMHPQFNPMLLSQLPNYLTPPHPSAFNPFNPLLAQPTTVFPSTGFVPTNLPLINSYPSIPHPSVHHHSSTNTTLLLPSGSLPQTHPTALSSPPATYQQSQHLTNSNHHNSGTSNATTIHHQANGISHLNANQSAIANTQSQFGRQPILQTNPLSMPLYGRDHLGILPHQTVNPILWTAPPNSVWW